MALEGIFYGTTNNSRIRPSLSWTAVQSVEGNYTELTVTLRYSRLNSGYTTAGNWKGTITLGDQTHEGKRYLTITQNSETEAMTVTAQLPHDEYGQLSLTVSATGGIYDPADSTLKTTKISGTITPDTIPRASEIRASDARIGSCATVVIGRRGDFTHSVSYRFGSLSGWLNALGDPVSAPVCYRETTLNFLLPDSFYEEIPDRPRDSCQLTCTTYFGDTVIGQQSCAFTVTADPELCRPVISGTVFPVDERTLELTEGKLIPGVSTVCCQVEAAAQKGATLVSLIAGDIPVEEGDVLLPGWALPSVPVVAVDSRGYESKAELSSPCIDYVQLTNLAEVARPEPTADRAVLTLRGKAFFGSFGAQENTLTAVVDFDGRQLTIPVEITEDGSYFQTVMLEDLSYLRSYPMTVTLADKAMTATRELTVRKGLPVFDWGEEDFRFHVPVEVPELIVGGRSLATYIRSLMEGA